MPASSAQVVPAETAVPAAPAPALPLRAIEVAPIRAPLGRDPGPRFVLLRACRPRQWVKNALVALAPAAAGVLTRPSAALAVLGAFVAFCLVASATYLVNDVRDREQDRRHPRKRTRPIASGRLAPGTALRAAAAMALAGLALADAVRPALAGVVVGYLALTTSYSIWWRRVAVLDILAVAGGFVLRALAGGAAAGVPLSGAFLTVTSACAVFMITGKRYAELTGAHGREAARPTRATLQRYSGRSLRRLIAAAAALAAVAYARWAFAHPQDGVWLELSAAPFALWLGRYRAMLAAGFGEAPEELVLRDPALLGLGALWLILFVAGIYVGS